MARIIHLAPIAALLLSACVVVPDHPGPGVVVAPALPGTVEFEVDPYYFYGGFYYYYHDHDHAWRYSRSRSGPWMDLPKDRYPREIRYKYRYDRDGERDRDHER